MGSNDPDESGEALMDIHFVGVINKRIVDDEAGYSHYMWVMPPKDDQVLEALADIRTGLNDLSAKLDAHKANTDRKIAEVSSRVGGAIRETREIGRVATESDGKIETTLTLKVEAAREAAENAVKAVEALTATTKTCADETKSQTPMIKDSNRKTVTVSLAALVNLLIAGLYVYHELLKHTPSPH
jgi:hypothetical protein